MSWWQRCGIWADGLTRQRDALAGFEAGQAYRCGYRLRLAFQLLAASATSAADMSRSTRESKQPGRQGFQAEVNSDSHAICDAFLQAECHIGFGEYGHLLVLSGAEW